MPATSSVFQSTGAPVVARCWFSSNATRRASRFSSQRAATIAVSSKTVSNHGTAYVGAGPKLQMRGCHRTQRRQSFLPTGGDEIRYVASIGAPALPWPPDPAWTEYGTRCQCQTCEGRVVCATVEELRAKVDDMDGDNATNKDTFLLRYLESARDAVVREAQNHRYAMAQ
jgi:hypothetical protein